MKKLNAFWAAYLAALSADVEKNPAAYALGPGETAAAFSIRTAQKMRAAVERGPDFARVNYASSSNFRAAAKAVGVPFNRAGLNSLYMPAEVDPTCVFCERGEPHEH